MSGYEPAPIDLKEIFDMLCDDCKRKVRALVKDKVTELITSQILGKDDVPSLKKPKK